MAWLLIKQGNILRSRDGKKNIMEFLIDSASDINNPPAGYNYAPTSLAHTPGYTHIYEAKKDGSWVEIGAGS